MDQTFEMTDAVLDLVRRQSERRAAQATTLLDAICVLGQEEGKSAAELLDWAALGILTHPLLRQEAA